MDLCMLGGIYSRQKCPVCGSSFVHDERRKGLFCPEHPDQRATTFFVKFPPDVQKRFNRDYDAAARFLTGLRYESDRGRFDSRDYKAANPLGFANLADEWLKIKHKKVRRGTWTNLRGHLSRAIDLWGDRNIKDIQYAHIEDFLDDLEVSSKTRDNISQSLKQFWGWCVKRHAIPPLPDWPATPFEMGYRNTTTPELQAEILAKVREMTAYNPRIYIGIHLLANHPAIRPGELRQLDERHIDRTRGVILVPSDKAKEKKFKIEPLLDEDLEILNTLPPGLPDVPFFRHGPKHHKPSLSGTRFSENVFYRAWRKACRALGIDGLDLYGGTKHTTVQSLRTVATFEEVRTVTQHATNKAFERYFRTEGSHVKTILDRRPKPAPSSTPVVDLTTLRKKK